MHLVSLQHAAGVESHFTEFVEHARLLHPRWTHDWLRAGRAMHPFFAERLAASLERTVHAKYRWGVKLPARPAWIRTRHCRSELAAARTDLLMVWNRSAKVGFALDALGAERCVHWEHGAAWDEGHEADRRRYFARVPLAIANSNAAARVLELLWDYRGAVRVCRNALRPSLVPATSERKRHPTGVVKLGVAARLVPVKGVALALHAVRSIAARGLDVELRIAGEGPERERLAALAAKLGVEPRVRFLGAVRDMRAFYRTIDCLVHPPITEAFGLVTIEAAAHGCPVIAAAIDGLPEAVADGVTGYCIAPTLPLADYASLGGADGGLPRLVFDPQRDALVEPTLLDPEALAAAVLRLFGSATTFDRLSAAASEHVLRSPSFAQHVHEVMTAVDERLAAI
jgi:glycosyltransferase involved in cell wall biosynthesis